MRAKFIYEAIKHLTPRSPEELRKMILKAVPHEAFNLAKKYKIELSYDEIKKIIEYEPLFTQLRWAKSEKWDKLYDELYAKLIKWAKRSYIDDINYDIDT